VTITLSLQRRPPESDPPSHPWRPWPRLTTASRRKLRHLWCWLWRSLPSFPGWELPVCDEHVAHMLPPCPDDDYGILWTEGVNKRASGHFLCWSCMLYLNVTLTGVLTMARSDWPTREKPLASIHTMAQDVAAGPLGSGGLGNRRGGDIVGESMLEEESTRARARGPGG